MSWLAALGRWGHPDVRLGTAAARSRLTSSSLCAAGVPPRASREATCRSLSKCSHLSPYLAQVTPVSQREDGALVGSSRGAEMQGGPQPQCWGGDAEEKRRNVPSSGCTQSGASPPPSPPPTPPLPDNQAVLPGAGAWRVGVGGVEPPASNFCHKYQRFHIHRNGFKTQTGKKMRSSGGGGTGVLGHRGRGCEVGQPQGALPWTPRKLRGHRVALRSHPQGGD